MQSSSADNVRLAGAAMLDSRIGNSLPQDPASTMAGQP
jgi:hypothetical protein